MCVWVILIVLMTGSDQQVHTRVSKCHSHMVVRPSDIFPSLRNILRIVCANQKIMHLNDFFSIFYIIHTYYGILGVMFALFLVQYLKTKVLTAQKNQLWECLGHTYTPGSTMSPQTMPCHSFNDFWDTLMFIFLGARWRWQVGRNSSCNLGIEYSCISLVNVMVEK